MKPALPIPLAARRASRMIMFGPPAMVMTCAVCAFLRVSSAERVILPLIVCGVAMAMLSLHIERRAWNQLRSRDFKSCLNCEYPLLGLPAEGSCPECGEAYHLTETQRVWKISWECGKHLHQRLGSWVLSLLVGTVLMICLLSFAIAKLVIGTPIGRGNGPWEEMLVAFPIPWAVIGGIAAAILVAFIVAPALRIRRLRRKLMLFRQNVDSV